MKIAIGSDHRGFKLKGKLIKYLNKKGYEVLDLGTDNPDSADYPDFGIKVGEAVRDKEADLGIVICGTGIGISIACNKVKGIRCAKVNTRREAKLTRIHNNANVIALNERMFLFEAKDIVDAFLKTEYKPVEKFERRIEKMYKYEEK